MGLEYKLGGYNKWLDVASPSIFIVTGSVSYHKVFIYFSSHFRYTTNHERVSEIFRTGGVIGGGYYDVEEGILRFHGTSDSGSVPDEVAYAFGNKIVRGIIEEAGTQIYTIVSEMDPLTPEGEIFWDKMLDC